MQSPISAIATSTRSFRAARDYSACVPQNAAPWPRSRSHGGSALRRFGVHGEGHLPAVRHYDGHHVDLLHRGDRRALHPGRTNIYNFAPLNYFQRPDERYIAGVFADYEITPAIKPYLEFMFMDDHTLAQIAPSGDFGNTLTINCDNPLMTARSSHATICNPTTT